MLELSCWELLFLAVAVRQTVMLWLKGSLFAGMRARLELVEGPVKGSLAELLLCSFCLRPWISGVLLIAVMCNRVDGVTWQSAVSLTVGVLVVSGWSVLVDDFLEALAGYGRKEPPESGAGET